MSGQKTPIINEIISTVWGIKKCASNYEQLLVEFAKQRLQRCSVSELKELKNETHELLFNAITDYQLHNKVTEPFDEVVYYYGAQIYEKNKEIAELRKKVGEIWIS
jgi:hypothetical protein